MSILPSAAGAVAFRAFEIDDLDAAVALSRAEAWPHRLQDWALLARLGEGVAATSDGRLVGTAFAVPFGRISMLTMIIVASTMRGRGLGRSLVERALASQTSPEWRLTATQDGLPLYRSLGFVETGEVRQYQGVVTTSPSGPAATWAAPSDAAGLAELDRAATGMDRAALIEILQQDERVAVLRDGGRPIAFGALRAFGRGEVIGPVVAPDAEVAKELIATLIAARRGDFVRIDVPVGAGLERWLEALGLSDVGPGIVMTRGGAAPPSPHARTFALASQALG